MQTKLKKALTEANSWERYAEDKEAEAQEVRRGMFLVFLVGREFFEFLTCDLQVNERVGSLSHK